jgi:hypothetical protein
MVHADWRLGAEEGFKLDLRQDCDPGRQDRDPGKQKLKGAVRTETYRCHYCQQVYNCLYCFLTYIPSGLCSGVVSLDHIVVLHKFSEVSQVQKGKGHMFSLICGIQMQKLNVYTKKT